MGVAADCPDGGAPGLDNGRLPGHVVGDVCEKQAKDALVRLLKVSVKKPGISVRHRSGYVSLEPEPAEK